jgi:hypothetical protein
MAMRRGTGWNGTGIPTLGVNIAPGMVRLPPSRVRVKLTQDPNPTTRVAGSRQETRVSSNTIDTQIDEEPIGEVRGGEPTNRQVRLASWLQDVMQDRPLREGKVISIGATAAQVRYRMDGEIKTDRFPVEEVFIFQNDGEIATAATDPNLIKVGTEVLIPQPLVRSELKQSITGGPTITPEIHSNTTIREQVAGSRQETRGSRSTRSRTRRPAR